MPEQAAAQAGERRGPVGWPAPPVLGIGPIGAPPSLDPERVLAEQ